ncbi:response regulator transcription factor [[Eubacterium] cellulosolvens]
MPDKILVVDDEPDLLNAAKIILERSGYIVVEADNGDDAIEKALSERPDLILSDVVMPGKSGLEVCKILKNKPQTKLIPILIFTVLGRDVDKKLSKDAGADGHLVKPFSPEGLVNEIKTHIEKIQSEKFSKLLDIEHGQLIGKNILFEFDPTANYERFTRDFVLECRAHEDTLLIISPKSSNVHTTLEGEESLEFIPFDNKILSPIFSKYKEKSLAIVYDNLTELIISMGFQPAYNFIRKILELLADYKSTSLFLFNPDAHPPNEANSIRNLFGNRVSFGKDGLVEVKFT